MNWEEYEKKCEELRKENEKYLSIFKADMKDLSPRTISRHLENVDFYINEYLLSKDAASMQEGTTRLNMFLGYYFIRKCMWSTPASIKSNAISIKKFYKCMMEQGFVERAAYEELCDDIKYNLEDWQADCAQYNDLSEPSPFDIW